VRFKEGKGGRERSRRESRSTSPSRGLPKLVEEGLTSIYYFYERGSHLDSLLLKMDEANEKEEGRK